MSTKKNTEIVKKKKVKDLVSSMDVMLTSFLLDSSLGEVCRRRENASNIRSFLACDLIISAIQDMDINLINQIIKRIDGAIPKADERDSYANLMGNAIDDVLDQPPDDRANLNLEDPAIIAMAKAIVMCALDKPGRNVSRRKDRQLAAEILLSRTGGSKSEPVKEVSNIEYIEPDWSKGLTEGK